MVDFSHFMIMYTYEIFQANGCYGLVSKEIIWRRPQHVGTISLPFHPGYVYVAFPAISVELVFPISF